MPDEQTIEKRKPPYNMQGRLKTVKEEDLIKLYGPAAEGTRFVVGEDRLVFNDDVGEGRSIEVKLENPRGSVPTVMTASALIETHVTPVLNDDRTLNTSETERRVNEAGARYDAALHRLGYVGDNNSSKRLFREHYHPKLKTLFIEVEVDLNTRKELTGFLEDLVKI